MSEMTVLDVRWFSGTSCVGVVKVDMPHEGIKYFISGCTGQNEEVDKEHIAAWGATFPNDVGDMLFGFDKIRNGNAVQFPTSKPQAQLMVALGMRFLEGK